MLQVPVSKSSIPIRIYFSLQSNSTLSFEADYIILFCKREAEFFVPSVKQVIQELEVKEKALVY